MRNNKGQFIGKEVLKEDEDMNVTFPIEKEVSEAEKKAIEEFQETVKEERSNFQRRMEIIDADYAKHIRTQNVIDWLMLITLSCWLGLLVGQVLVIIFK